MKAYLVYKSEWDDVAMCNSETLEKIFSSREKADAYAELLRREYADDPNVCIGEVIEREVE